MASYEADLSDALNSAMAMCETEPSDAPDFEVAFMSVAATAIQEVLPEGEITLTVPQSEFFSSDARYTAAVAGFGSGKTQVAVTRLMATKLEYPTIDLAYLAPTYSLVRDIFYPYMSELLSYLEIPYLINKSEHNIYLQGYGKVICRTMDNPDMLVGWDAGDAFLDEFDILKTDKAHQVMRKLSARLRQQFPDGKKNQRYVTTTPEGFKATYELFRKNPLPDSSLTQMSTYSNAANLPDDYIQGLIDLYPKQLIEAYLNGEFVNLQAGSVYYSFDRQKMHVDTEPKKFESLLWGMDFNVMDMCASCWVRRGKHLHAVDEFMGLRDTPDMIEAIKEEYPKNPIIVFPDASGSGTSSKSCSISDIKLLRDAGFKVKANNKNPLIKNRVAAVNKLFEDEKGFINTERCPELTMSIEQQAYDKKTGQPEKDGNLDNRNDGAGYLIHYLHPINHKRIFEKTIRGL